MDRGSAEDVELAITLVRRIFEELSDNKRRGGRINQLERFSSDDLTIPRNLLQRVVHAWSLCRNDDITDVSPRFMFEMAKDWGSLFPTLPSRVEPYLKILQTTGSEDPRLAEEILNYLLESKYQIHKRDAEKSFNSVIDAWGRYDRADAPMKAEAVLRKMISLHDAGLSEAIPDVHSYSNAIKAWTQRSSDKNAPHRAEKLLHEMQQRGLDPDRALYGGVLTAWARSKEAQGPRRAYALLKHMVYEQGNVEAKPDAQHYATIISARASRGDVQLAEKVFLDQIETYQSTGDRDVLPTTFSFNAVINAWSKSGRPEAPHMAEAILQRMQDLAEAWGESTLVPDVVTFNSVLTAWAQSGKRDAPLRCQDILQRMQTLFEHGQANSQPDQISFDIVLTCLAKSARKDAPERAEAILRDLIHANESGKKSIKPETLLWNKVMSAWVYSDASNAADRAQAVFDKLDEKSRDADSGIKPNIYSFATLITAWGRSNRGDSAVRAQAVFDDMLTRFRSGDEDLKPGAVLYGALIDAWARAGNPERAELIFRDMESKTPFGVKPNIIIYHTVMNSWALSDAPNAAERMQVLFDELLERCQAGDRTMKPRLETFGIVITAWGRSRTRDSAFRAQAGFDRVLALYRTGDKDMKPNDHLYKALIDAMARSGLPERAELILREVKSSRPFGVRPDVAMYNATMNAWNLSGAQHGAERAHSLFDELKRNAGDMDLKPNSRTFGMMITAWARSKRKDGGARAQAVFDEMFASWSSGDEDMKPENVHYNALIDAWAKAGDAESSEKILRQMESSQLKHVKPSVKSYVSVMRAWSRSSLPCAAKRAQALFHELLQKYKAGDREMKPDIHAYGALISAWSRSKHKDRAIQAQAVFDDAVTRYKSGDKTLEPGVMQYNSLIGAWAKAGEPEMAESILREMDLNGSYKSKPDKVTYGTVIVAWARSGLPNAAARAQSLYDDLKRQFQSGDLLVKPNSPTFYYLISAWCQSTRHDALPKAQSVFYDLLACYRSGEAELKVLVDKCSSMIKSKVKTPPK